MQFFKRVAPTLIILLLAGCVSVHKSANVTEKYAQKGISTNSVQLAGSEILSFGRLAGEHETEIVETRTIFSWSAPSGGQVAFLTPTSDGELGSTKMRDFLERGASAFLSAVSAMKSVFDSLDQHDLHLDIVLASWGSGAYYSSRGRLDGKVPLSVIYFQPTDDEINDRNREAEWWLRLVSNVTHEIYHVHHELTGIESSQLDEETAAEIVDQCAVFRYAKETNAPLTADFRWVLEDPRTRQAFPHLKNGQLTVDLEQLEELGGVSTQGRGLGSAVLYLLSSSGVIDVEDSEKTASVISYCEHLAHNVPNFHLGEW